MSRLASGYSNNVNILVVRTFGSRSDILTDRAIDIDGDGSKEQTTVVTTEGAGNKIVQVVTRPAGASRSVVASTTEADGGSLDTEGNEHSEGLR